MATLLERNYNRNLALSSLIAVVVLFSIGIVVVFLSAQGSVGEIRSRAAGYKKSSYGCMVNDPNACGGHPNYCQCLGGPACPSTICADPALQKSCEMQGRAWCVSNAEVAYTCCPKGYGCSRTQNGCFKQ